MRKVGDLKGRLISIGHIVGWFGGPQVFIESSSAPTEPVFVDVGGGCYALYATIVG